MSIERRRLNSKSKPITSAPAPDQRLALFGPPLLLPGEDDAAYDTLLARIHAAVKPIDIIDEMFVYDLVSLEWEVLRWRRLKSSLIRVRGLAALEDFLRPALDYDLYENDFEERLTEILLENLAEDQTEDSAAELAHQCARNEPDAVAKVNALLTAAGLDLDRILNRAQADRAEKFAQSYARREPQAVKHAHELLNAAGRTIDDLVAEALAEKLDDIERIDRLTTIAETRRNASLHEIDRRRATRGAALRRSVQEIEDGEFEVIETTPANGKNAA